MTDNMKHGISIVALAPNGDVAGVALNAWTLKDEGVDLEAELKNISDPKFSIIMRLLHEANAKLDFFTEFGVDRIFDFRVLSVSMNYRGQGIGRRLMEELEKLARQEGAKLMIADFTGLFSQKISEKLGWQLAHEVVYNEYRDKKGQVLINAEPPHTSLQVKYKLLN